MKRKPLLFDEFAAIDPRKNPFYQDDIKKVEVMQARMRDAKVFVFDQQAAIYAAEMIRDYPHVIAHDQEFAIPPFQRMYIELPYPIFFRTLGGVVRGDIPEDTEVGYYYDNNRAYVLSRSDDTSQDKHFLLPIRYRLNQPFETKEELEFANLIQTSRLGLDALFWGSVIAKISNDDQRALRALHSCEPWPTIEGLTSMQTIRGFLEACAGDLRNIIALILFLNRTKELQYRDELPGAPAFVHAKPRTLVRHSVVKMRLNPGAVLKRIYGAGQGTLWRREHDVRGHFCHDKVYRNHKHEHDLREYDVNQWRCMNCGGLRWWRKEHRRGRKELGQVKTTYEVTQ